MHTSVDGARLLALRTLVTNSVPVHQAIAMLIVERDRVRDRAGLVWRIEEARLLLSDGSEWLASAMWVRERDKSLTLRAAAYDLKRERLAKNKAMFWKQVKPACMEGIAAPVE